MRILDILDKLRKYSSQIPEQPAVVSEEAVLNYRQLFLYSDTLASYLIESYGDTKEPVVVYGHKNAYMIVCFLACVKAGRAYCPVDVSVPWERTASIIESVNPPVLLVPEQTEMKETQAPVLNLEKIKEICMGHKEMVTDERYVRGDDTFYIIFTSGSSGTPKGVKISSDCLNHFLDWAVDLGIPADEKAGKSFLNQAPFSFDLSVMDLYTCLACGGTLYTMSKEVQGDYQRMFELMRRSNVNVWVSTPSFADLCLADRQFSAKILPELSVFLFCGETLTNRTALLLKERFPDAAVMNTYGPTESTVALTGIEVDEELARTKVPLPVGKVKPGSVIEIWDGEGKCRKDGEQGEIVLLGDTVSTGYYQKEELTRKAFFLSAHEEGTLRGYHTGDAGYLENGMLYYCGRMDRQIKLHGYRIELDDIEQNILKADDIKGAVVTVNERDGKITGLTAHVVSRREILNSREEARKLREKLKRYLPDYMIPKKICFLDVIPMTANGKADRKLLQGAGR